MDISLNEIKVVLKSLVQSSPTALTVTNLKKDFRESEGYAIPFGRLGYSSLESFLKSLGDTVIVNGTGDFATVNAVESEKSHHIMDMVQKQKSKRKQTRTRAPRFARYNAAYRPATVFSKSRDNNTKSTTQNRTQNTKQGNRNSTTHAKSERQQQAQHNLCQNNTANLPPPPAINNNMATSLRILQAGLQAAVNIPNMNPYNLAALALQQNYLRNAYNQRYLAYNQQQSFANTNNPNNVLTSHHHLGKIAHPVSCPDLVTNLTRKTSQVKVTVPEMQLKEMTNQPSHRHDVVPKVATKQMTSQSSLRYDGAPNAPSKEMNPSSLRHEGAPKVPINEMTNQSSLKHDSAYKMPIKEMNQSSHRHDGAPKNPMKELTNQYSLKYKGVQEISVKKSEKFEKELVNLEKEFVNLDMKDKNMCIRKFCDHTTTHRKLEKENSDTHKAIPASTSTSVIESDISKKTAIIKNPFHESVAEYGERRKMEECSYMDEAIPEFAANYAVLRLDFPQEAVQWGTKIPTYDTSEMVKGNVMEIMVTEVHSPFKFWFQLERDEGELASVMGAMKRFYGRLSDEEFVIPQVCHTPEQVCAAKYIDQWHRAEILAGSTSELTKVYFMDYGTVSYVNFKDIKFLMQPFARLPCQALRGSLSHIQPKGMHWTFNATKTFLATVTGHVLYAQITEVDQKKNSVHMILCNTDVEPNVQLNSLLIKQGYALLDPEWENTEV